MLHGKKGQCHRVKFLLRNILVNTRINILQWILTKLGTYLDLKRIWNPIEFAMMNERSPDMAPEKFLKVQ
jgi:hypothetical protein